MQDAGQLCHNSQHCCGGTITLNVYFLGDGTGQTYEQAVFFSENIMMEKSIWIYKKLIM